MNNQTEPVAADSDNIDLLPPAVLATMEVLGGKWKIPVLWLLWKRGRRFGELRRALRGVTQHVLTSSLRQLEADGLVRRTVHAEVPPRVEYALTESSMALCDVFLAMQAWGERAMPAASAKPGD